MAQVLEAASQGMDGFERRVAIKRLLPQHLRDGGRRRMFFDEASIGSRLHHGGVVQIIDYGLIDGAAFLAMEFVDGVDALRALTLSAEDRLMPEGIALHVISEVAHALAYIHDVKDEFGEPLGIVHRDVSPQNILLSWDGDVKLSDFGIALSMQREERTAEGVVKGKLPYMAPEQALGERVNAAADVYALGATLSTLLGGRAMGPAMTDAEVWSRVGEARERGVSAAVAELIGACTCREPRDRLRAADVAAAAGSLAFQKLSRGARATLRDWLAPLKPKDQEGSALDDLMGLCLVPVAGQDGGRTFTVSQMMPIGQLNGEGRPLALRMARDPRAARTSAPIEIQMLEPPPLTRGQRIVRASRWVATAVAVATAATFTAWRPGSANHNATNAGVVIETPELAAPPARLNPRHGPRAIAGQAQAHGQDQAPNRPQVAVFHAAPAGLANPAAAKAHATSPAPTTSARRARRTAVPATRVAAKAAPSTAPAAPLAAATTGTATAGSGGASDALVRGWLRVGGAGLFGGQVTVDGEAVGFAPLERALPVGAHSITVVSPASGQTLVRQTIRVGGYHTRIKPLSLLR